MSVFVNFSNHPSAGWSEKQLRKAREYGEVVDIPFPNVDSNATEQDIAKLAEHCILEIEKYQPAVVMCQGEFTLCYAVITRLKNKGLACVAACSERKVVEVNDGEKIIKQAVFEFCGFRKYE